MLTVTLLLLVCTSSFADAQQPKKTRRPEQKQLPELRAGWKQAHDSYFHGELLLKRLRQQVEELHENLRDLEREETQIREADWLVEALRTRKLQQVKQKKHSVGDALAKLQGQVHTLGPRQELRRETLIDVGSALVLRQLEVADRIYHRRPRQAKSYIADAMKILGVTDNVKGLVIKPPKDPTPQLHPIDPNAPLSDLKFRLDIYEERLKELGTYAKKLASIEERRSKRVKHLARLDEAGRGGEAIRRRLDQERKALARVMNNRRLVKKYQGFYRREIEQLKRIIKVRSKYERRAGDSK